MSRGSLISEQGRDKKTPVRMTMKKQKDQLIYKKKQPVKYNNSFSWTLGISDKTYIIQNKTIVTPPSNTY